MKKIKLLFTILLLIPFMVLKVNAASAPYQWIVGGEYLDANSPSNYAGTATQTKENKTVTLTLNNYNGGKLELNCYGTGQEGMEFIIELIGDNTVTSEDVGIQYDYSELITFTGDGTLTVKAPNPLSWDNHVKDLFEIKDDEEEGTVVVETTGDDEETTDTLLIDENKTENKKENTTIKNILAFLAGVVTGLVVVLIIGAIIKALGKPKQPKAE